MAVKVSGVESLVLYVADVPAARSFYGDFLGLPRAFEDDIVTVFDAGTTRVVLHRRDLGHNDAMWPVGDEVGAAGLRFAVDDPDAWEQKALDRDIPITWSCRDAPWGRFVLLSDPDGRPVALARMAWA